MVVATWGAFAALGEGGKVGVWGDKTCGGEPGEELRAILSAGGIT